MCVRYSTVDERWERFIRRKGIWVPIAPPIAEEPGLFPGSASLMIRPSEEHGRELVAAAWGLQPHWAKRATLGRTHGYNARAEGSEDNPIGIENMPMFREPFRERRCLVPASAFFERVGPKGDQRWMRISPKDEDEPLLFLGLWNPPNEWTEIPTFTIVTTDPPEGYVHDRIPVMKGFEEGKTWMADHAPVKGLKAMLHHGGIQSLLIEDYGPVVYKTKAPKACASNKPRQEELF